MRETDCGQESAGKDSLGFQKAFQAHGTMLRTIAGLLETTERHIVIHVAAIIDIDITGLDLLDKTLHRRGVL